MGEGAVVRGDNILSGVRFGNNALPVGTNTRIHNGDKDGVLRPVGDCLDQAIACLPNRIRCNIVGQIMNFQLRADAVGNAVHGAHGAVHKTEVRLKNQWFHRQVLLFKILIYHILFPEKSQSSVPKKSGLGRFSLYCYYAAGIQKGTPFFQGVPFKMRKMNYIRRRNMFL